MKVHKFVSNDLTLRASVVNSTLVVAEMQKILNAMPLAALGVGRAMTGALLMASHLKPGQEVGVFLKGNGPLGSIYGHATFEGKVRGYCPNPTYEAPDAADYLNLKKAMGNGNLTVSRQQPFQKQPHNGTVEMISGEVGEDIAHYLHQSHQIRSLVNLGAFLNTFGQVQAAGGIILEVMPGVEEEVIQLLERNTAEVKTVVSRGFLDGATEQELLAPYLKGIAFTQIPHDYEVEHFCPCTLERVLTALSTLGVSDLEEMIEAKESPSIQCQMCGKDYQVNVSDLAVLKESLVKNSMH